MKTLRDWDGDSNELILHFLKQFTIEADKMTLLKYEVLTPDSFIWIFSLANNEIYCLYAEDYIPSVKHVKERMYAERIGWNSMNKYELLPVSHAQAWNEASPVTAATTYQSPERPEDIMKYAATSGFDFVFLAKVTS